VPEHGSRWWLWLVLAGAVVLVDQLTKAWVLAAFRTGETLVVLPFFSLVLAFNTGAAFSFLAGASGWQRWLFVALALAAAVLITVLLHRGGRAMYLAGLSLILGGAVGNVWDRLALGKVVDFLLIHYQDWYYPAFNVADSAITVGAGLLILDSFLGRDRGRGSARTETKR